MKTILKKIFYLLLIVPFFACAQSAPQTKQASKSARPLVGVSCGEASGYSRVSARYADAVRMAGATPILIPVMADSVVLRDLLSRLDGLIISGGEDVAPSYYGEAPHPKLGKVNNFRDTYDFLLARIACDLKLPTLGICRGVQVINVAFGGSLYQDIPSQCPGWTCVHRARSKGERPMHNVKFEANSQLAKMFGATEFVSNSSHHQSVKKVAPGFKVVARSTDSCIEAIESTQGLPMWGVQFHPEVMATREGDKVAVEFFRSFVAYLKNGPQATTTPKSSAKGKVTEHIVASGDTLHKIARTYGTTLTKIEELNPGIDVSNIRIGQKIKVQPNVK